MRSKVLLQAVLVLVLMATAAFAQPAVPSPVCEESADAQLLLPLTPEPMLRSYPPPGYAIFHGSAQQPNCVWTCFDGSVGGQQVTSEVRCRQTCRAACPGDNDLECFVL